MHTSKSSFGHSIMPLLLIWLALCCAESTAWGQPSQVTAVVSAASNKPPVAAKFYAVAYGTGLAGQTVPATTDPLPTELAGTTLTVTDSMGMPRLAPLRFVSPNQINFLVPTETATGVALVTVRLNGMVVGTRSVSVAPGIFAANDDERGVARGYALRYRPNGSSVPELISRLDTTQNRYVAVPIDLSNSNDRVFLILFGTGFRSGRIVMATIGDEPVTEQAVAGSGSIGEDQVNLLLPPSLSGRGEVDIVLEVDGKQANIVTVTISSPMQNPTPTLASLNPNSATAVGPSFTLTVNGTNFVNGSVVRWNGQNRQTTFVSSTQLTAQIPASDLATAGTAGVTVFNPAPGGGVSNTANFTISCSYTIQPTSQSFNAGGGTGSVTVTTASGCAWTATSNPSFITITSGASGSGNGTVNYSVTANTSTSSRTGTLTIAGQTFTVTQAGATPNPVAVVSAASFTAGPVAPDSIAAAFGTGLAEQTLSATATPLPTVLAGTTVEVNGQPAGLFFVSAGQINFQVPVGTAPGNPTVTVRRNGISISAGNVQIATVAPGLFSANSDGIGVASGTALRVRPNGSQVTEPISRRDAQNRSVAIPIDLTIGSDQVFLILFGTGLRFLSGVSATIGGEAAEVTFAGAAPGLIGTDQVNLRLPLACAGGGRSTSCFGWMAGRPTLSRSQSGSAIRLKKIGQAAAVTSAA